jgi:tRNA isopentenyl-2-thiomethyl-A-37 hydroxylase MiaE
MSEQGSTAPAALDRRVVALFSAIAYGELAAYFRMSADAAAAPSINHSASLARLATIEFSHYYDIANFLDRHGVDVELHLSQFAKTFESFHDRTKPSNWNESLMKAYVGDSIAIDFFRSLAEHLEGEAKDLVLKVSDSDEHHEFLVTTLSEIIAKDVREAGRLALWARRLVGEAFAQAQAIAAEHQELFDILAEIDLSKTFKLLTERHTHRMQILGLAP